MDAKHKMAMKKLPSKDKKALKHIGGEFAKLSPAGKKMDIKHDKMAIKKGKK